ncbi:MAG: non-heme iron oxygenase ferredoxin subunit [Gammaproteobacteria bacterium]|nr:non-heme iron oxygenase ferredoxin subunit [Gammaproteobacteria bacterium]
MSDWTTVVAVGDLPPGKHMSVEVEGAVMVLVNLDGEFYAIEDICTHDGSDISSGCVVDGSIECPRHGARFDIRTGEVTAPPAYEPVDVFPVRVQDGVVQVRDHRWD